MNRRQKKWLARILISAVLLVVMNLIPAQGLVKFFLYLAPYLILGYKILINAAKGVIHGQIFDENFLMAVATVGALAIAAARTGDYNEAVAVMLFYNIGEFFQSVAVGKSRKNISEMMDIRPDYAYIEVNGKLEKVSPDEVPVGTVISVLPGEKIPIDGVVLEGNSDIDSRALTGESVPFGVSEGDSVISGCINMTGLLKIRTTKEFGASTVSKILDLVENASSKKAKAEAFITKFAKIYTPIVCLSALILAILPPLIRMVFLGLSPDFSDWIYRALTFLVISCPCALVLSIPLSFFAGIGGASREGILVKGSNYFETLAKSKIVVFDKTGTLTCGEFRVSQIFAENCHEDYLLEIAALAESRSTHPIAKSLTSAYGKELDLSRISKVQEVNGKGVIAEIDGKTIAVGNGKLMSSSGVDFVENCAVGTSVYMAENGKFLGSVTISDIEKPTAKNAIKSLKNIGISKTVMLTGDRAAPAKAVAESLGLDSFCSGLLPNQKVEILETLLAEKGSGALVFVGDGINDAPVLSRADVGIAMGAMGSDAAIESADVVLMDDDPMKVSKAIKIAKNCMSIVYQNIVFSIGVKIACLILGALGYADLWLAIFADVGVMVIAVLNAIRVLFVKKL
ncbi:MAG: cadmium-translocating P-type ATPase [Clostridia bacterium]|nr:cadmium-translocating P-type ATPase [Clostridia bacterium]